MTVKERENFFLFDCQKLGIEATDPSYIAPHLLRYFTALSYAMDLPEDCRDCYVDVGCGSGYGTELIGRFFSQSHGLDRDKGALEYAREIHGRSGTNYIQNLELLGDSFIGRVDFVTCIEMLEHVRLDYAPVLLDELKAWLKPTGVLFLTTPVATTKDGANPANPWHLHEYQPAELKELLSKFFGKVQIQVTPGANMIAVCGEPKT